MRHYLFFGAVAAHSFGMPDTAQAGTLVAPAGRPERLTPCHERAILAAILLAAITVAADAHLLAASGAQEEARYGLHRLAPSSRTKMDNSVFQGDTSRASLALVCRARHRKLPGLGCRARLSAALPFYPSQQPASSLWSSQAKKQRIKRLSPCRCQWRAMSSGRTAAGPRQSRGKRRYGANGVPGRLALQRRL